MRILNGSKIIEISNVKKLSSFGKVIGLMFCRRKNAKALLFEFKKQSKIKIHSLFVFFPFVAVWLDDKNKIVDRKIVKPFRFSVFPKKSFSKLIEIPIDERHMKIVDSLVGS